MSNVPEMRAQIYGTKAKTLSKVAEGRTFPDSALGRDSGSHLALGGACKRRNDPHRLDRGHESL